MVTAGGAAAAREGLVGGLEVNTGLATHVTQPISALSLSLLVDQCPYLLYVSVSTTLSKVFGLYLDQDLRQNSEDASGFFFSLMSVQPVPSFPSGAA